ncbi:YafY family protein [Cellulomonas sp. PhB150]|nr:WYL domain-containing protein [Cellulomonas sp. PhB150]ROS30649.1 proteasome accessory factor B [Cellulomonas sp. PhB150]
MATTPAAAERLLNLVIALVNTPGRMTKEQVRTTVAGYGDAPSDDAFERMFERDKDTLRELGVPVLTVTDASHGDDFGYRIDLDTYALAPIDLTAAELGVLTMAAELWQDRSLRADSTRALTKLRAVGQAPGSTDLVAGLTPRVRDGGGAFAPLVDAVQSRQAVRFTYRAATSGEVRERVVEPWKLLARRGGWVLVGRDRDRGASRSFRLSRIEGAVRTVGPVEAFETPAADELAEALSSWDSGTRGVATLAVLPERASALRTRHVPDDAPHPTVEGRDVLRVPYRAQWELAEEVVGYGDAVLVLEPASLRDAALSLLRTAAALDDKEPARG